MTAASAPDLLTWRLHALGLGGAAPGSAAAEAVPAAPADPVAAVTGVVSGLFGVQAQDRGQSRWAIGSRVPGARAADVDAAYAAGSIVRSWPGRSTVHAVAAGDLAGMQRVTNHRVLPGAPKRRATIGLPDAELARMTEIALRELAGGRPRTREQLAESWLAAGVPLLGPWRYHAIWFLCQTGRTVLGPLDAAGEQQLVLAADWLPAGTPPAARDTADAGTAPPGTTDPGTTDPGTAQSGTAQPAAAQPGTTDPATTDPAATDPAAVDAGRPATEHETARYAHRYAAGRGPVLAADLAWWSGLTVTAARRALAAAEAEGWLARVTAPDGAPRWAEPALLDSRPEPASGVRLIAGYDELVLGYRDRSPVIDPAQEWRLAPARNGIFLGAVLRDGRIVGTWKKRALAAETRIEARPLPGERLDAAELAAPAAAWGRFHGVPARALVGEAP